MADKPKGTTTKLRITACTSTYTGTNTRGDEYTIYEVTAVKGSGEIVTEKLRSFENLPLEVLDLTVTKYVSEKHGVSYTLARTSKPNSGQKIEDLTERVDDLLARVVALEEARAPAPTTPTTPTATTQDAPATTAAQSDLDARFGTDPPF